MRKVFLAKARKVGSLLLGNWVVAVSAIGIGFMMVMTTTDVVMRYVFQKPIVGVLELNEVILVFVVYSGLAYCQREKGHLFVDMLVNRFEARKQAIVRVVALAVSVVFFAFVAPAALSAGYKAAIAGEFGYGLIRFPRWPGKIVIGLGVLALCVQLIVDLVEAIRHVPTSRGNEL